jgi:DNA gyrase inhibitor GyrI
MPQLVVNMKVNTQNIISRSLKMMGSKMRQAPYLNRYNQFKDDTTLHEENIYIIFLG